MVSLEPGEIERGHIFENFGSHAKELCCTRKVMGAVGRFGVGQNILPSCRVEVGLEKVDRPRNMVAS